eukprot:TRINITY_DN3494_c0_g1_i1.p1 TRINITY_DN3494_c0_g1~~TRINITY_DN3494_c0_g1_i1.p1  ORF type:complete len:505 (-),score=88.74 TRINITY_DN3494_c0_g1_i1:105-1619(-)
MGRGEGGSPVITHVVTLMLENRSFDHMIGWLMQQNPNIDGLDGTQVNPFFPGDPNSLLAPVTKDAPYIQNPDPDHSIPGTSQQIFGVNDSSPSNQAFMNGFVSNFATESTSDYGASIMNCHDPANVPAISTLGLQFAVFDRWFASVPGPTEPNRLYVHTATSHGLGDNKADILAEGVPQPTIYDNLYNNGYDFGIYYGDFPAALFCRSLRKPEYLGKFKEMLYFYEDCQNGTLPTYSFIEPRYFDLLEWKASDQHPPHDVRYGEYLIAEIYTALRNSPLWNSCLFIITYDEHGGFFDHVPTPIAGVPNPDGLNCADPPFEFNRLGVRVPCIMVSPWIPQGIVVGEPPSGFSPTELSQYDHSSIPATLKTVFGLPDFLTLRDAWSGTFDFIWQMLSEPRTDCPLNVPTPSEGSGLHQMWKRSLQRESKIAEVLANPTPEQTKLASKAKITELQWEFIRIAAGLTGSTDFSHLTNEFEAALFVRDQLQKFFELTKKSAAPNTTGKA